MQLHVYSLPCDKWLPIFTHFILRILTCTFIEFILYECVTVIQSPRADKYARLTELFNLGLGGDVHAYDMFLQDVNSLLCKFLVLKLPRSDVEDVVQEILISIHKARHTYDGIRPIMPWIMAITQFRLKDHLRKLYKKSRNTVSDDILENFSAPDVTESDASYESMEDMLKIVPPREQKILTLMHGEGYTAKETGVLLNMKESAVKVAAHRALKKLKERRG